MMLRNRLALVTGGTGALGSTVARRLSSLGAQVTATYLNEASLEKIPESLKKSVTMIKADMTVEADVIAVFDRLQSMSSHIDIVVNTVGGYLPAMPLAKVSVTDWDRMLNINLRSTFLSTREAIRRMQGQSYGRIINMSAMAGVTPMPGRTPYAIAKASVSLLSDLAGQEVKGSGVTVNAVAPSIIATTENVASIHNEDTSKWVTTDQIADLVCYLCSEAAGSITSTTIKSYGGI